MVQFQAELQSSVTSQSKIQNDFQYNNSTHHRQKTYENRNVLVNQVNYHTPTSSSIFAWREMLDRSTKRLEKYNDVCVSVSFFAKQYKY